MPWMSPSAAVDAAAGLASWMQTPGYGPNAQDEAHGTIQYVALTPNQSPSQAGACPAAMTTDRPCNQPPKLQPNPPAPVAHKLAPSHLFDGGVAEGMRAHRDHTAAMCCGVPLMLALDTHPHGLLCGPANGHRHICPSLNHMRYVKYFSVLICCCRPSCWGCQPTPGAANTMCAHSLGLQGYHSAAALLPPASACLACMLATM